MKRKILRASLLSMMFCMMLTPVIAEIVNPREELTETGYNRFTGKKAGTYFIDIDLENAEYTTEKYTTKIHVKFPKTQLNYSNQEGIDAHDILVLTDTFDANNKQKIIDQANAHAWSMETGKVIENINVLVKDAIKYTGTINQVEFFTDNDTSVEVNVFEQDEINIALEELYMNQYPVVSNSLRTLSKLVIALILVPTFIFFIIFAFIKKEAKEMEKLLGE